MNKNLLIIGAGIYGLVAKEIAESMGCFENIAFVDDDKKETPNGIRVVGTTADVQDLAQEYGNIVVAIGNADIRISLLKKVAQETNYHIATLISPMAYISPSAKIKEGCIIEPMAVVHTQAKLLKGCIISAGAVVNHGATCKGCVHVDCNATVVGYAVVPVKKKIGAGEVFKG